MVTLQQKAHSACTWSTHLRAPIVQSKVWSQHDEKETKAQCNAQVERGAPVQTLLSVRMCNLEPRAERTKASLGHRRRCCSAQFLIGSARHTSPTHQCCRPPSRRSVHTVFGLLPSLASGRQCTCPDPPRLAAGARPKPQQRSSTLTKWRPPARACRRSSSTLWTW